MEPKGWLAFRALVALALMIGFYAFSVAIALALLWLPYAEVRYAHRIHPKLALGCIVGAIAIVWAILPRRDKFEPPGPAITRDKEPRLFDAIGQIAAATGQPMPAEVYAVGDVNAWVASRGGVMGIGSRRVMGLGLPLMQALNVNEFRGVLAHEFGHYHAGDVALGPWIHKTRGAIVRAVVSMSGSALQKLFILYGNVFLRVTHVISRRQELIADALAAKVAGAAAFASGLAKVHTAALAYQAYMRTELAPVVASGLLPPVAGGFGAFLTTPEIASQLTAALKKEVTATEADPYDTHPPLRERLAAVGIRGNPKSPDAASAISLLAHVRELERDVLAASTSAEWCAKLKPIEWAAVPERVYIPQWEDLVKTHGRALEDLATDALPSGTPWYSAIGASLVDKGEDVNEDGRVHRATTLVYSALALALKRQGWMLTTSPGQAVRLTRGDQAIEPFAVVNALAAGRMSGEQWAAECVAKGVATAPLR